MSATIIATGMGLSRFLFSKRGVPVDLFPAFTGMQTLTGKARRNRRTGALSWFLCKAACAALTGCVTGVRAAGRGDDFRLEVEAKSLTSPRHYRFGMRGPLDWLLPRDSLTYHVGLLVLAEALAGREEATDLLQAWQNLISYTGGAVPRDDLEGWANDPHFRRLLETACDELWFWAAYRDRPADRDNSRLAQDEVTATEMTGRPGVTGPNLAPLLTDPAALRAWRKSGSLPESPVTTGPVKPAAPPRPKPATAAPTRSYESVFEGPQLGHLIDSVEWGFDALLTGPTGVGKTTCVREAARILGRPLEIVEGKEGLDDLYLLGTLVPVEGEAGRFAWRDGPVSRAFRRAAEGEVVILFVDEINRLQRKHTNLFIGAMNRKDGFYQVEIPQTAETLSAPVERLRFVAACNLGSQYAVTALDPALDRRFETQIEFGYLPDHDEIELVAARSGLAPEWANVLTQVAAETRRLHANAELPAELDTSSLIAWATKVRRLVERDGVAAPDLAILLVSARTTWLPRVAGRDHRGNVIEGNAQGLEDFVETVLRGRKGRGQP